MPDPRATRYWGDRDPAQNYRGLQAETNAADSTAELRLYDPIDSWGEPFGVSAKDFTGALDALPEGTSRVTLRINSPGGEVGDGLAILNALRAHAAKVDVIIEGRACSAASVIAMAGDTVTMARQAQMMVHDAAGIGIGNAAEMAEYVAFLEKSSDNIAAVYADRAGGTTEQWRDVMRAETWFSDEEAVAAGLADKVAAKTTAPKAALTRFDLAIFNHAGREQAPEPHAPTTPAAPGPLPVTPPNNPEGADLMSDTLKSGLRERFGFAEDADDAAVLAAVDSARDPEITDDTVAAHLGLDVDKLKAAVDAAKAGKVTVSQSYLDAIEANAKLGAEARAEQHRETRDKAIDAAIGTGHVAQAQRESWQTDWDRDPAGAKAELDKITAGAARFPLGEAPGHQGDANAGSYTAEMAAEDEAVFGLAKGALTA